MINFDKLLDALENDGYYIEENVLDDDFVKDLKNEFLVRKLDMSHIGKDKNKNSEIRNDHISWLTENETSPAIQKYQKFLNTISNTINNAFYLGLNNVEAHFAKYEKGNFYKKHKDSFKNNNSRLITVISYLNEDWKKEDNGILRIYKNEHDYIDVEPKKGTVVCFLSEKIEHEVLPSNNTRYSITSWMRKDKL